MINKVHFKTNILLKNIIGKDLITDDNVAMLELVKNSYDAGSKIVEIVFQNVVNNDDLDEDKDDSKQSRIMVCDKGCGMDYDGLLNKWLNIAYSEKKEKSQLNGRRQAGNKGVGRFSCDRLGKTLTIYTKMGGQQCLKMTIDWRLFENEDAQNEEIQDIEFEIVKVSDREVLSLTGWNTFENGTVLDIHLLRDTWNPEKIVRLRRDLEKFIDPNSTFSTDSFSIDIKAEEYRDYDEAQEYEVNRVNGRVENKIFEQLNFRTTSVTSYIEPDGSYIVTKLQDRGREVFALRERNIYPHLRNIKMTVYYLNPYSKRYFKYQTGLSSLDFGSIFLFINGFRIPPYGDQGDDWLGIEKRKAAGFRRYLSTREVVGRVEIRDEHGDFMIISSRTGVVNNDAFMELSREGAPYGFFYKGFRRLERFVVEGISWDTTQEKVSEDGIIEGKEKFKLDDLSRDKQILSVIRQIIDIDESAIDYLHINEEFVEEIMNAQMETTANNIEGVVKELSELTDNASPEAINKFKARLQGDSEELERLVSLVGKIAPAHTNLNRLYQYQEELRRKQQELAYKQQLLLEEKEARDKAEQEKAELEKRLALEKEKNTYLLSSSRSMSEDAKGMVHTIKIISQRLHSIADNTYNDIQQGKLTKKSLLINLGKIIFQSDKALKISKLITRANFKGESENKIIDVVAYISQYIDIYKDIVQDSHIDIIRSLNYVSFEKKISVLDVAVIFDNLISNSEKAGASTVQIDASLVEDDKLKLIISDNGEGLNPKFESIEDSIFDLGVTTTDGSGIGLHTVRTVVKGWRGSVRYIGKGLENKGAKFEIVIPK